MQPEKESWEEEANTDVGKEAAPAGEELSSILPIHVSLPRCSRCSVILLAAKEPAVEKVTEAAGKLEVADGEEEEIDENGEDERCARREGVRGDSGEAAVERACLCWCLCVYVYVRARLG